MEKRWKNKNVRSGRVRREDVQSYRVYLTGHICTYFTSSAFFPRGPLSSVLSYVCLCSCCETSTSNYLHPRRNPAHQRPSGGHGVEHRSCEDRSRKALTPFFLAVEAALAFESLRAISIPRTSYCNDTSTAYQWTPPRCEFSTSFPTAPRHSDRLAPSNSLYSI